MHIYKHCILADFWGQKDGVASLNKLGLSLIQGAHRSNTRPLRLWLAQIADLCYLSLKMQYFTKQIYLGKPKD